jgi:hypothetical protein
MDRIMASFALLLLAAGVQANDVGGNVELQGFLHKNGADASQTSLGNYNKFIAPSLNHMKTGNGPDTLSHHANLVEHGLVGGSAVTNSGDDSKMPIGLFAIGFSVLSFATMLGARFWRGMQPANALASTAPNMAENFLELGGQNGARKDNFGWLQRSSERSRQLTVCYAAAKTYSADVLDGIGVTAPFGKIGMMGTPAKCWDPIGFTERTTDPLLLWYRAAELKHSRVAMLACTGWLVNQAELYFPGNLAPGTPFSSLGKNPLEAWNATPYDGKLQILVAILLAEFHSEFGTYKKHYTKGGPLPGNQIERTDNGWRDVWGGKVLNIPFGPDDTEEMFRRRQNAELNNGRLAMIGIMGFSAAALVPGSVPALDGLDGVVAQGWTISA